MSFVLHFSRGSTATIPHAVIEEAGFPYQLKPLDQATHEAGILGQAEIEVSTRVPALQDGTLVVFETGAIVLHLLTKSGAAHLMPPYGSNDHARFLQWLFYLTTTPKMAILEAVHPELWTGDWDMQRRLRESAEIKLERQCDFLDANLSQESFLPSGFSALDIYLTEFARWTRSLGQPMWLWPNIARIVDLTRARPAYQKMLEIIIEKIEKP